MKQDVCQASLLKSKRRDHQKHGSKLLLTQRWKSKTPRRVSRSCLGTVVESSPEVAISSASWYRPDHIFCSFKKLGQSMETTMRWSLSAGPSAMRCLRLVLMVWLRGVSVAPLKNPEGEEHVRIQRIAVLLASGTSMLPPRQVSPDAVFFEHLACDPALNGSFTAGRFQLSLHRKLPCACSDS